MEFEGHGRVDTTTHERNIICSEIIVGRQCESSDHYLWAVICRSQGRLCADEKEGKSIE